MSSDCIVETTPTNVTPSCFSISSSVLIVVSKYSSKKAIPTPIIPPNTIAIAIFNVGFGSTGDGFSGVTASDKILTLSTFMSSTTSSWKTATVALAIFVASYGSASLTATVTTCESSSLDTLILSASSLALYGNSNVSTTSSKMALLVMMTLYVLMSSTFVRIVPESICISESSCLLWLTINCDD